MIRTTTEQQLSLWRPGGARGPRKKALDWDFKNADTQYLTHGVHPYPARMIPQIASQLIILYVKKNHHTLIVDPFCGSGTVNVEASLRGCRSVGVDVNPFAVLLAKVKVTEVKDYGGLIKLRNGITRRLKKDKHAYPKEIPDYDNIEHWFKKPVIETLSFIKHIIKSNRNEDLKDILWLAFANALMKSSNVDWKSSRYIRVLPEEKLKHHNPDVLHIFTYSLLELCNRVRLFSERQKARASITQGDARCLALPSNFADLVITSPPYGEERNTIPYLRWSKLFLLWLGISNKEVVSLEKLALGGKPKMEVKRGAIPSRTFRSSTKNVSAARLAEALPFMQDYIVTLVEMKRILKPGAKCCIVIGHRSIQRNLVDMGKVTQELGSFVGFRKEALFRRSIPKKMIPWTTPTGKTIASESIVVLSKSQ